MMWRPLNDKVLLGMLLAALLSLPLLGEEAKKPVEEGGFTLVFLADSRPVLMRLHVKIDGKSLTEIWNEFVGEIFDRADANKDGALDKVEAAKVPLPQAFTGGGGRRVLVAPNAGPGVLMGLPNIADSDDDGKFTRRELADYYRKAGLAPLQLVQASGNDAMNRRAAVDALGGLPTTGQAEALNKAILSVLDTDKDGKLSKMELEAAPQRLLKKDADDDDIITVTEARGQVEGDAGYQIILSGGPGASPLGKDSPLMQVDAKEANRDLAAALLQRYARTAEVKKMGKLTAKDLGMEAGAFKKLDADEDGKLDREELARFARRNPDLALVIELGKKPSVDTVAVKDVKEFAGLIKEKDGAITLSVGNTHLSMSLRQGNDIRRTVVNFANDTENFYKMQFANADQDSNGYLDETEVRNSRVFRDLKAMDADGDGKLYLKEITAYLAKQQEMRDKVTASTATLSFSDQGRGLFDLLDGNGDGRLSIREMREAVKLLAKLDGDGDGAISPAEVPRRYQLSANKGIATSSGNEIFAVSLAGRPGVPTPPRTEGPLWFRKMDRNRDGDVSRREFLGTEEQFKAMDSDGDGLIALKEAEAFDGLKRKKE